MTTRCALIFLHDIGCAPTEISFGCDTGIGTGLSSGVGVAGTSMDHGALVQVCTRVDMALQWVTRGKTVPGVGPANINPTAGHCGLLGPEGTSEGSRSTLNISIIASLKPQSGVYDGPGYAGCMGTS